MSDVRRWCRLCPEPYGEEVGAPFCPIHPGEELRLEPVKRRPDSGGGVSTDEPADRPLPAVCWRCGTRSAHAANTTCASCHEPLAPPALVLDFPAGLVVLRERPTSAVLGRAGKYGQVFAGYPNVSRRHATVGVDETGNAWIEPIPEAPNGTFVNDREIVDRTAIGPHDQLRFATDRGSLPGPVSQRIRQPWRER